MSRMMLCLRKTRPEAHATAFNENSKTIFEQQNKCHKKI